jgi:hypothetical protein
LESSDRSRTANGEGLQHVLDELWLLRIRRVKVVQELLQQPMPASTAATAERLPTDSIKDCACMSSCGAWPTGKLSFNQATRWSKARASANQPPAAGEGAPPAATSLSSLLCDDKRVHVASQFWTKAFAKPAVAPGRKVFFH